MSGGRTLPAEHVGKEEDKDRCRRIRLSLPGHQSAHTSEQHSNKQSSIAVVLPQKPSEEQEEITELITPTEEKVEVIKVYLEARPERVDNHPESLRMLTDEVSQIQEVRYCLKTLREQMAARQSINHNKYPANGYRVNVPPHSQPTVSNGNTETHVDDNRDETLKLKEATKCLYAQLKELEKKHQEERDRLQAEISGYRFRLAEQSERLQTLEGQSEEKGQRVEELQRLLGNMEIENSVLKEKIAASEAELLQLKEEKEDEEELEERCAELEKDKAILKEKIHHLDDMLKSQQRKVRNMIEQLQNSRTIMEERDRVIGDLEEKVAFLEAENREMHDHMDYFLAGRDPPPLTSSENKPQVIYSKPLNTLTQNKSLPLIKVIEIKS